MSRQALSGDWHTSCFSRLQGLEHRAKPTEHRRGHEREEGTRDQPGRPPPSRVAAFAEGVAAGRPRRFALAIGAADAAAARREELPAAVDVNRQFAELPAPRRAHAYEAVHKWRWMAARRALLLWELLRQPV